MIGRSRFSPGKTWHGFPTDRHVRARRILYARRVHPRRVVDGKQPRIDLRIVFLVGCTLTRSIVDDSATTSAAVSPCRYLCSASFSINFHLYSPVYPLDVFTRAGNCAGPRTARPSNQTPPFSHKSRPRLVLFFTSRNVHATRCNRVLLREKNNVACNSSICLWIDRLVAERKPGTLFSMVR